MHIFYRFVLTDIDLPADHVIKIVTKIKTHFYREAYSPERTKIRLMLLNLLKKVSKDMREINWLYEFEVRLVGSSCEGTRPFYPDEYDFLLLFRNILDL